MSFANCARASLLALVVAALAGCESFNVTDMLTSKVDYRSASRTPPLEIPPDLTSPVYDDRYLPKDSPGTATFSGYEKERSGQVKSVVTSVLPVVEQAHIERAGSQRWLVVNAPPEKVWATARDFWLGNGFTLVMERPELGIMETDWAENRAKINDDFLRRTVGKVLDFLWATNERDKFRTRIERGAAEGTTEVYLSHRGMQEVMRGTGVGSAAGGDFIWTPRPADPELEAEMLRRLLVKIGLPQKQAEVTVAKAPVQPEHAQILKGADGYSVLSIDDGFDRAWRRVGLALDRIGFTVVDRDRSAGTYYVRYVDPDSKENKKDEGFLTKLQFWKSENPKDKEEQYRIVVAAKAGGSSVVVQDRTGKAEATSTGERIITLLHGQLK